jgi:excisionase family DNA binding protein
MTKSYESSRQEPPPQDFSGRSKWGKRETPFFEKLITVEELAEAFGFAPQTIRNWVALRSIPFIRVGGKTRFRRGSIETWLERKESKPCP